MTDQLSAMADALYGGQSSPPAGLAPATPEIAELRNTPERQMYPTMPHRHEDVPDDLLDGTDFTPEERQAQIHELRHIADDLRMERGEMAKLLVLHKQASRNPPDAQQRSDWRAEAELRLRQRYGPQDMWKARQAASQLAKRDPRVAALLGRSGIGDHPDIVELFAQLARR